MLFAEEMKPKRKERKGAQLNKSKEKRKQHNKSKYVEFNLTC